MMCQATFVINQNFPNPFNPSTSITYFVPKESFVSIKIYDFLGREVKTLVNDFLSTGSYEICIRCIRSDKWNVFLYYVAGNFLSTKKDVVAEIVTFKKYLI